MVCELSPFRHSLVGTILAACRQPQGILNATQSGRFFVGPAYSVCLLLAQDRSQSLNVSGHYGKCHVTLESHNAVIAAQIQSMRLTTSISRVAHRWPRRCGRNSHPGRECFRENTRWRSLFSPGRVQAEEAASEWRAQIDHALAAGLQPGFLDSHEHIHMPPPLFVFASTLAARYGTACPLHCSRASCAIFCGGLDAKRNHERVGDAEPPAGRCPPARCERSFSRDNSAPVTQ